jgi:hypothetical protein
MFLNRAGWLKGATVIPLETLQLVGEAVQQTQGDGGSPAVALIMVKLAEGQIDQLGDSVSSTDMMEVLGNVATVYERIGMLDIAAERMTRLCQLAERDSPNTTETAGDYSRLALLLEKHGDVEDALMALERSAEHLRAAGAYDRYAAGYEPVFARLRSPKP